MHGIWDRLRVKCKETFWEEAQETVIQDCKGSFIPSLVYQSGLGKGREQHIQIGQLRGVNKGLLTKVCDGFGHCRRDGEIVWD